MNARKRVERRAMQALSFALFLLVLTTQHISANESHAGVIPAEMFLTGDERAVIDRFVSKVEEFPSEGFANPLDHALAVLISRAYPKPEPSQLIREAVLSLCEELQHHTQQGASVAQREIWVDQVSASGSFEGLLRNLDTYGLEQDARARIVEEGLKGMLKGLRPGFGRLLERGEVNSLKQLREARQNPAQEPGFVGLNVARWPILEVLPETPASEAGLQNGDRVVMVNEERVSHVKTGTEAMRLLAGSVGEPIELTVSRGGQTFAFEVRRAPAMAMRVQAGWVGKGVAYLNIPSFEGSCIGETVRKKMRRYVAHDAASIIIDLRDNSGGRPEEANAVADLFLDSKLLQLFEFKTGVRIGFKSNPEAIDVGVVILTNKSTASAAEALTMVLRDNGRAVVVGETTAGSLFGKDGAELSDGHTIFFRNEPTVLSPTGKDYLQRGIPPDIPVADSRGNGKDAILARATELASAMSERDGDGLRGDRSN